ncbi:glycoside hydrolase family 5 protein [Bifidobacterium parmae]|uniref:Glycosyl hydrolase family 5 n=1 Tax=Bifidobacterium parmae TaxID=361854 RepID=A0A2N5J0U6_9BIFI|nr:cellulase family glycosylhydrolase [Bifidobacterium parmae]PLS27823.1 glycosyl hydrolase family 5 [Bifidobacterium parmae]
MHDVNGNMTDAATADERIDGVNLGGWLVLERWMTPGLFRASGEEDEIWLHRTADPAELERLLRRHRDTYVTEDDFRAIAAHGLNLVRIPVPYFVFGDVPGHPGCIDHLDRAFDWAERVGIKVLIDLHTVPGSQNGFDNGGITGVVRWHRSPRHVAFALDVLARLAERYRDRPALYGIEVLNEPVDRLTYLLSPSSSRAKDPREARGSGHIPTRFLKRFYRAAYRRLRPILGDDPVIVFHDGFRLGRWRGWFAREGMRNVLLDTHVYLVMSERPEALFRALPDAWLMRWYRLFTAWHARRIRRAARFTPVMVGEWCIANRLAARVDDVARRRDVYRAVAAMQRDAWNVSAGRIYWSYRLRGGRDVSGRLARLAPVGGDGIVTDDSRLDPWDLTHVWHAGWMA